MRTDSHLQLDVIDELSWEPGLDYEIFGVASLIVTG